MPDCGTGGSNFFHLKVSCKSEKCRTLSKSSLEVRLLYHINSPKKRTQEQLQVFVPAALDYSRMTDYIRSWPGKLVSFVSDRLCDDDFDAFVQELYEYLCVPDRDGPAFEEWCD